MMALQDLHMYHHSSSHVKPVPLVVMWQDWLRNCGSVLRFQYGHLAQIGLDGFLRDVQTWAWRYQHRITLDISIFNYKLYDVTEIPKGFVCLKKIEIFSSNWYFCFAWPWMHGHSLSNYLLFITSCTLTVHTHTQTLVYCYYCCFLLSDSRRFTAGCTLSCFDLLSYVLFCIVTLCPMYIAKASSSLSDAFVPLKWVITTSRTICGESRFPVIL